MKLKQNSSQIAEEEAKNRVRGYAAEAIHVLADEDSLDYTEENMEVGKGVRVPLVESHSRALLDNTASPYGYVVPGKTYTSDKDGKGLVPKEDFTPHIFLQHKEAKKSSLGKSVDVELPEEEDISVDSILNKLQEDIKKSSEHKIKFMGSFGTFTGNFLDCTVSESYVICVYKIGDSVFIPPNTDKLIISDISATAEYSVGYVGVTFEIPQFNAGFIVFNKLD